MSIIRVAVLTGGRGTEKEVSFNSGRTICDHLDTYKYSVIPIFQRSNGALYILPQRFLHRGKIADFEHRLDVEAERITWDELKKRVDFVYIAMHGRFAEDGTVQGFLEVLGIPYLGSKLFASALSTDKLVQKTMLKAAGITVPNGIAVKPEELDTYKRHPEKLFALLEKSGIQTPYVVKPSNEGSSMGVSVVFAQKELLPAVEKASAIGLGRPGTVLIEERILGMEFSCILITDYKTGSWVALPPTEIVLESGTHFFDYEQKYMPGRSTKFTPARCTPTVIKKIQSTCIAIADTLKMKNVARIDGILTPEGTVVSIDPNPISGMAPASFIFRQAAEINMSHTMLINHLIETELWQNITAQLKKTDTPIESPVMKKKKIGVLLGARSHEREISLESGRNVIYKLSPEKYEAIPLFVDQELNLYRLGQRELVRNSTKEIALALTPDMQVAWSDLPQLIDFAFIALHGGEGENGAIQGTLEMLNVPYNGSSILTSALCMDKYETNKFLRAQGFEVPNHYLVDAQNWSTQQAQELANIEKTIAHWPLIVKPHDDGCSVLVSKAKNEQQLIQAINAIFADGKQCAFVEECIEGMELTVGCIGNIAPRALAPSQAVCIGDILSIEEKFLPGAGENQTPAPLPTQSITYVQRTIEQVYTALNCKGYSRIDCFYQTAQQSATGFERLIIIECNTLPGLTPATCIFHQAAEYGLKPMEFIDLIIELGFEEHSDTVATGIHTQALAQEQTPVL